MSENSTVDALPFASVIVPAYNERGGIAACIEALLAQDYPAERREIIIVDNNSTDGMDEVIKQYPVTLLYEREIQTPAAARNRGIRHAQGEIVAFIDADCIAHTDWLRQIAAAFSDPGIVGAAGVVIPLSQPGLISEFMTQAKPMQSRQIDGLWYVITANAAYRREALMASGLLRPHLFTAEDIELGLRLQLGGYGRIVEAAQAIVDHPFANTWEELWERYRRYGYSEILLDAMYRGQKFYLRSPGKQARIMLRQVGALLTYSVSFVYRAGRSLFTGWDRRYVSWPLLWFAAEGNNLLGKFKGLRRTRFLTHVPSRT